MKHEGYNIPLVFFFMLLCLFSFVHSAKRSIIDTSSHGKRTIMEESDTEHEDVCAVMTYDGFGIRWHMQDIIGKNWNMGKQGESPCPKLNIWVPRKLGFTEFVKVNEQLKVEDGFSIAIFCYALQALPFPVQPNFRAFDVDTWNETGTHHQHIMHLKGKTCDAVAGDFTIRSDRAQHVSFTIPYLSSEVYMLVHAAHEWNQTLSTFLKPFTWRLWIALFCAYILTGVAVAILEYRAGNREFKDAFYSQVILVIWFPISTFFFQEGKILNKCSKVVLVMWLSMIFIVLQIFTATLSSWLTVNQLRPSYPLSLENFGYQYGSFLNEFILQKYNNSGKTVKNLIPLKDVNDYKNALSSGRVDVVIDELPYIEIFLAKYGSDYMKIGPINQEPGIAFVFPHESPMLHNFSRAVIYVTESEIMMDMMKKYLGFSTPDKVQPNQALPQSLDVQSFIGLFVIMGIVTLAAIVFSEISLTCKNRKVQDAEEDIKEKATISK